MSNVKPIRPFCDRDLSGVGASLFAHVFSKLSDADLDKLTDELDFFSFAGVPSARILKLLDEVTALRHTSRLQIGRTASRAA